MIVWFPDRMKVLGNFSNGDLHELVYKREGKNMYLTVSQSCTVLEIYRLMQYCGYWTISTHWMHTGWLLHWVHRIILYIVISGNYTITLFINSFFCIQVYYILWLTKDRAFIDQFKDFSFFLFFISSDSSYKAFHMPRNLEAHKCNNGKFSSPVPARSAWTPFLPWYHLYQCNHHKAD